MTLSTWAETGQPIPASLMRVLAFVASGGTRGIADPGDLKVLPLAVPGGAVRITPGGCLIPSNYGVTTQSYVVAESQTTQVAISPTTSQGGRIDLITVRISDVDFGGSAGGANYAIHQNVPAQVAASREAAVAWCQARNDPQEPLASITIPASTATITDSMITDLRGIAMPKQKIVTLSAKGFGNSQINSVRDWQKFPNQSWKVEIPAWATHVTAIANWNGVYEYSNNVSGTNIRGNIRTKLGSIESVITAWDIDDRGFGSRNSWRCASNNEVAIPSNLRGTIVDFEMLANCTNKQGTAYVQVDNYTSVDAQLIFVSKAV